MNKILTLLWCCAVVLLSACDSGNIEEDTTTAAREGLSIRLSGRLSGAETWSDRYQLVLAAFDGGSDYSLVQKEIPMQLLDGDSVNFVLSGIPAEAEKVQLCVVDRVRERVATFADFKLNAKMFERTRDTLRFDVGRTNVSMYSVVEDQLFDNLCSKCHGNNGRAAAAMDLRKGHAYASTVGVAAHLDPTQQRIVAGHADNSWLVRVLTEGNEGLTHYKDHTLILNNERDSKYFTLLKDWINAGAKP